MVKEWGNTASGERLAFMSWGTSIIFIVGMTLLCCHAVTFTGEAPVTDGITSLRKTAIVTVGGEFALDYSYRNSATSSTSPRSSVVPAEASIAALALTQATLRLQADVHPNVSAFFKLDFGRYEAGRDNDILEEAMLVMSAVGGTGLGFFAGRGRAPYGQDITLGMLQSYHHSANQSDSGEGPLFIGDMPEEQPSPANPTPARLAPMRPGQMDRVAQAGLSYSWQDRWKVEVAAFQPGLDAYRERFASPVDGGRDSGVGGAVRVWWRPLEELVLQFSVMLARSPDMARIALRRDIVPSSGVTGTATAYAASVGFDWRRGPWRVFGEYQHGWDWNFTEGYSTDTWQAGMSRDLTRQWRVGAMVEGLHIDDAGAAVPVRHDVYKLALNVRYSFANGMFVIAEYGREWLNRERGGAVDERREGDFAGMRIGFVF